MQTLHFRNVVLGAGAMGSAAAYHLARRGEPVCLVEQFALGHERGSSHGSARITRHSYADVRYARLMPEAFRAWRTLEADAGQNLYLRTGGVSLCRRGDDYVAKVAASLHDVGVEHRRMTGKELRRALPVFEIPDDSEAVYEPDAGILAASKAVRLQVQLAREFGKGQTVVMENCPVLKVELGGEKPCLVTGHGRIIADRLIVTAGAWTSRLVPSWPVPLRPTRQQVLYFRPDGIEAFAPGRFPVFIVMGACPGPMSDFYGMPAFDGLGVKVARHGGPDLDLDVTGFAIGDDYRDVVRQFLRTWVPALANAPIDFEEICVYTLAPDEQFHLGPLPGRSNVIVASTCSGHGFKFSALIGRVLADLCSQGDTDLPIAHWSSSSIP